jgi:hypothetical protein
MSLRLRSLCSLSLLFVNVKANNLHNIFCMTVIRDYLMSSNGEFVIKYFEL